MPAASAVPRCAASTPSKIEFQRLPADFAFQLGDPPFGPTLLPVAWKHVAGPFAKLTPPAVHHVRVHFHRSCYLADRNSLFQPPHRGQLELLGEHPSRQPHKVQDRTT